MTRNVSRLRFAAIGLFLAVTVAGLSLVVACGGDDDDDSNATPAATVDTAASPAATTAPEMKISGAWVRTTTNDVSAAYFVVDNPGEADTLVSAKASVGMMAQLHEVITDGGSSKMQQKEGGFPVPAKGELELKPGSFHVMIMGIKEPLAAGDTVDLTLQFEHAGTVNLKAPVLAAAPMK